VRGLLSIVSWRTFLVGFVLGFLFACGMRWAVTFKTSDGRWVEEVIPYLTPRWSDQPKE